MKRWVCLAIFLLTVGMFFADVIVAGWGTKAATWSNVLTSDFALMMAWLWLYEIQKDKEVLHD